MTFRWPNVDGDASAYHARVGRDDKALLVDVEALVRSTCVDLFWFCATESIATHRGSSM